MQEILSPRTNAQRGSRRRFVEADRLPLIERFRLRQLGKRSYTAKDPVEVTLNWSAWVEQHTGYCSDGDMETIEVFSAVSLELLPMGQVHLLDGNKLDPTQIYIQEEILENLSRYSSCRCGGSIVRSLKAAALRHPSDRERVLEAMHPRRG
jgi:hypothetical protein